MAYTTINDPSAHFHAQLYTGNGSELAVTNNANSGNFQPDWIWIKDRSASTDHFSHDTSRTITKRLEPNGNAAERNNSQDLKSVQSNGFTVGNNAGCNSNTNLHVAWQWKANGGTTATNTDGATNGYNTTVQANQTAGFSIVKWNAAFDQGNGRYNLGHGLGKMADFIAIKNMDASGDWYLHHKDIDDNDYLRWNLNNATSNTGARYTFYRPAFTTSIFNVDYNNIVTQNQNYIAYVFATIKGYSHFGSYTGNGASDGPFIYTGFKPQYVWFKRLDVAENWYIYDSTRDPINEIDRKLFIDDGAAEGQSETLDFVSNGIKLQNSSSAFNTDGGTYIYAAFAKSPFVSSAGVPTTAR